jgi:GTPase SAR1 family protein
MAKEKTINFWLESFKREAGIRRGIVLHGDVLDVYASPENPAEYITMRDIVQKTLKAKGFKAAFVWDKQSGIHGDKQTQDIWNKVRNAATLTAVTSNGEDYDLGGTINNTSSQNNNETVPDVDDFLSVVYKTLTNPNREERYAFVLDWSQYLFGNAQSLSEQERQWLLILTKTLNNAPQPMSNDELDKPANLVVLLTSKLGNISPVFYQSNASVREIVVPSPGRNEREQFLKTTTTKWNLTKIPKVGEASFNHFVDATEGLAIRDLQQMIRLSRQTAEKLSFEKLINLYRYGETKSPWEDLSKTKLRNINEELKKRVKGQDEAVQKIADVIIRAYTGLSGVQHSQKQRMPKGTLFFVGPTGVGKTELAKSLAQFLFGDEEACIRFDMSEFNHEHSDQRLVGAPPGYTGYEEGGQLTNAVKKRPFSVLLFDEIEKAHIKILDKFLQILEDGRLTDGKGETVYFSETIIIFTSNIGAAEIEIQNDTETVKEQFKEAVKKHFSVEAKRPELLNRIGDNIVPFNFITNDDFLFAIAEAKLQLLRIKLQEKYKITDILFKDKTKALKAIFQTLDKKMGGRGVLNEIVRTVIDPLSRFLFEEEDDPAMYADKTLKILQIGNEVKFEFTLE